MARMKCPTCGKAYLEPIVEPVAKRLFEGVEITVKDASFSRCPACGEETYSVRELARWRKIKDEVLSSAGQRPLGADVQRVRTERGLSVAHLASLLGVTRQAVYGWERDKDAPMKFGPAALLVLLLMRELSGKLSGVFAALLSFAKKRGQLAAVNGENTESDGVRARRCRLSPVPPGGAPRFRGDVACETHLQKA